MNLNIIKEPFPYLLIENVYDEQELALIWDELKFLTHQIKLEPPQKTASAKSENGEILKNNSGIFLDTAYSKRELSNILMINSKIFSKEIIKIFSELNFCYQNINTTDYDETLISYYENCGYYKPHTDHAIYTAITWFFRNPKCFFGGDFYFSDYDVKTKVENNMTIIFPSFVTHHVDEIKMKGEFPIGNGRYAMTQFLYINPKKKNNLIEIKKIVI